MLLIGARGAGDGALNLALAFVPGLLGPASASLTDLPIVYTITWKKARVIHIDFILVCVLLF